MRIDDADRVRVIVDLARVLCSGDSGSAIRMLADASAYLAGTRGAKESDVDAAESTLRASRVLAERVDTPIADPGHEWSIGNVSARSAFRDVPDGEAQRMMREEREEVKRAKDRHDPVISRTLMNGPGNRRKIRGCACGSAEVTDEESWVAHTGISGAHLLREILRLQDAISDAVDYRGRTTHPKSIDEMLRLANSSTRYSPKTRSLAKRENGE